MRTMCPALCRQTRAISASMLGMLAWFWTLVLVHLSSQQMRKILCRQRWRYCSSALRCLLRQSTSQNYTMHDKCSLIYSCPTEIGIQYMCASWSHDYVGMDLWVCGLCSWRVHLFLISHLQL
eukprot:g35813.t1